MMLDTGLYIVTLNNEEPISVNANDPRLVNKCIRASRLNCKFGKAKSLALRRRNYCKVFGSENVNFCPIAFTSEIAIAEKLVLNALTPWRVRGKTGRKNEWLIGISDLEVERVALDVLVAAGICFEFSRPTGNML